MNKPILCLDFDGVCHMYTSKWKGATVIPDPHVPGLFEFLEQAQPYFNINVFSSRSHEEGGIEAMMSWFASERLKWREAGGKTETDAPLGIEFPKEKPPFFIGIDDRVLTFRGSWPDVEELRGFRTWTQNPLGATNTFPRGKITNEDEGALRMAVGVKDGTVFIDFGTPVEWLGLDSGSALNLAGLLIKHAETVE